MSLAISRIKQLLVTLHRPLPAWFSVSLALFLHFGDRVQMSNVVDLLVADLVFFIPGMILIAHSKSWDTAIYYLWVNGIYLYGGMWCIIIMGR